LAPGNEAEKPSDRNLIGLSSNSSRLWFVGRGNRFRGLSDYLGGEQTGKQSTLQAFRARLDQDGMGSDEESVELPKSPWMSAKPLESLAEIEVVVSDQRASLGNLGSGILAAFQPAVLPELQWKEPSGIRFAGAEKFAGVPFFAAGNEKKAQVAGRHVIVPGQSDPSRGIHPSIEKALEVAKSGDVVLIRHSGTLKVDPVKIRKVGFEITIRPDTGSKPVLVFDPGPGANAFLDLDRCLLVLEDLTILVDQGMAPRPVSLVALENQANCQLRDCSITLLGGEEGKCPVLASLAGIGSGARPSEMFQAVQPGRLGLRGTTVRGFGSLLRVNAVRPIEVDVTESNLYLGRELARVETPPSSSPMRSPILSMDVSKSNLVLGASAVIVEGGVERPVPDWLVRTNQSKWICWGGAGNCLVRVEGALIRKERLKDWWRGTENQFSNWAGGLEGSDADFEPRVLMSGEQWQETIGQEIGEWCQLDLQKSPVKNEWATVTPSRIFNGEAMAPGEKSADKPE